MRILKILGACTGILIVLIAVVLAIGLPGGMITGAIQNRFEQQTGYRLAIGAMEIGLRPMPTVTLTHVALSDPQNRDNSIQLEVERIKAQIPFGSLLTGKPRVDQLVITGPVLHAPLRRDRARSTATSSGGASGNTVNSDVLQSIGHVEIDKGTILLADKRRGVENRLDKVGLDLTVGSGRRVKAVFNAETGG